MVMKPAFLGTVRLKRNQAGTWRREVENRHFSGHVDLSHPIYSQYIVPKPGPNTIKIFIKTKAGGNRAVRKANQSADWRVGRARSRVGGRGHFKCHRRPHGLGLDRPFTHPSSPP